MNKQMKRMLSLVMAMILTTGALGIHAQAAGTAAPVVNSLLDSCEANNQIYTMNDQSRIFVVCDTEPAGELLQTAQLIGQELAAGSWVQVVPALVWGPETRAKAGDLVLKIDGMDLVADGYRMDIGEKAVIAAADPDGLLYGAHSLMKCFREKQSTEVQGFTAISNPDAKERTVHLDVARKYFTPQWIQNFIRQMSWMGYNALELHFSEDGGFRANFWDETYYNGDFRPENDFSWLCGSRMQYWVHEGYRQDPDAGKYLTTEDLVKIIHTARQYHIDIIPSFDSPAHMNYLTWKFADHYQRGDFSFTYGGTTYKASDVNGNITGYTTDEASREKGYRAIDITNETAKAFVFAIYADIADFFRVYAGSTKFNIGGDEVPLEKAKWDKGNWTAKWEYEDFPKYITELNNLLRSKGYTCRMYNDFIGTYVHESAFNQIPNNIEIVYWNSDAKSNGDPSERLWQAEKFVEKGRTVYNGIQTSTYYVLRVANGGDHNQRDARNPENKNWSFYNATEDRIFNQWKPAYIRSWYDGIYEKVAPVPADQLGGGYFMIWNDYAALNTESQIWEGAPGGGTDSGKTYYLIDRMWSNISKMWLPNLNSKMTYDEFVPVRNQLGYFPGYTDCTVALTLSAAADPVEATLADHSALETALNNRKPNLGYTDESWSKYQMAIENAEKIHANKDATEQEITEMLNQLQAAEKNLTLNPNQEGPKVVVHYVCNDQIVVTRIILAQKGRTDFCVYVPAETGYRVVGIEGGSYRPLDSRDGSGFVSGTLTGTEAQIRLICEEKADPGRLQYLVSHPVDMSLDYSNLSAYKEALSQAESYLNGTTLSQTELNELVEALEQSRTALTVDSEKTEILKIEPLAKVFSKDRQIGLRITTTPDVDRLTVSSVDNLTLCVGEVQKLADGTNVKIWLVEFPAALVREQSVTIQAGIESQTVQVPVE